MKVTGKKSLAWFLKFILAILFVFFAVHLIYFLTGSGIAYYKYHSGSQVFNETILIGGNSVGFNPEKSFQLIYPFTNQNFMLSELTLQTLIIQGFGFSVFTFYLFCLYKIFHFLSHDVIFNESILRWLSIFMYLNLFTAIFYMLFWGAVFKLVNPGKLIMFSFPFLIISIFTLFLRNFFKKGYELQSEHDLTI